MSIDLQTYPLSHVHPVQCSLRVLSQLLPAAHVQKDTTEPEKKVCMKYALVGCFVVSVQGLLSMNQLTGPPSAPQSLMVESSANVSCRIRWEVPSDEGGRSDTFYNITYMEEGSLSGSSVPVSTDTTDYILTNLKPVTTYQVRVTAENGVSHNEVSLDDIHQRTAVVVCSTTEGGWYMPLCLYYTPY